MNATGKVMFGKIEDVYLLGVVSRFCGFKDEIIRQCSICGPDRIRLFELGLNDKANTVDDVGEQIGVLRNTCPQAWDEGVEPANVSRGIRSIELAVIKSKWVRGGINSEEFRSLWVSLWEPEITLRDAKKLYKRGKAEGRHWDSLRNLIAGMKVGRNECR